MELVTRRFKPVTHGFEFVTRNSCFTISQYFAGKVKVELATFKLNATKADFKNAAGLATSKFAKKVDLASLKSEVDKLDTDKLEKVPTGLNSLKVK